MGIRDHLKRNWVEYIVMALVAFFLLKTKRGKKIGGSILGKIKKSLKDYLKEGKEGK